MSDDVADEIEQEFVTRRKKRGRPVTHSDIDRGCDYFWAHYGKKHGVTEPSSFNPFGELVTRKDDNDAGD